MTTEVPGSEGDEQKAEKLKKQPAIQSLYIVPLNKDQPKLGVIIAEPSRKLFPGEENILATRDPEAAE